MTKNILPLLIGISLATAGHARRMVCDETCKVEFQHPAGEAEQLKASEPDGVNYAVVSPVGRGTVEMIEMAPRLSTLDGKTIAVVGGSFMASITHPEIKKLILEHYPTAKVLLLDEIGSAGVYPAPGITRRGKDEFQKRLRDLGVDAVISGNCGCGLCTPKEVGSCIAAEYAGVPSVAIAAPGFVNEVYYTEINNGVPAPRVAEYPGAFAAHTRDELIRNTREVLWPRILDGLTRPVSDEEVGANAARDSGDPRDDVFYGTLREVNEHFREMKWSDGLPIVPPTYAAVEEFLKYTDMRWDETVAVLPVAHRNTLVWHVAVNGVMAGCKPEFMPILIAVTKALGAPEFRRTLASTHGWIPYGWLNGPVARQLGISSGQGEISDDANMMLGRFLNLALMNLAGYYAGDNRMGTFGYPQSWFLAEDDRACAELGWQPYHVSLGYDADDNTVTLSSTLMWGNNMAPSTTDPRKIMELIAWDIAERCQFALGSGKQYTNRVILITAPVASNLAVEYESRTALEKDLIAASRRPLKERVFANYYANPGSNPAEKHPINHWRGHLSRSENAEYTAVPPWYDSDAETMMTLPTMKEGMTVFLVTGDDSRNKVQTMPGGGCATVWIELPRDWDTLTRNLGYKPLTEYNIK
ncbi:MAG: hypothetical protein NC210_06670 [[Clostridium] fimetarium]|nr:hypothetical protein [Alistipes timonensis]MCM1406087.1 hypothetical protein [[Clostridium] fimetarium]